jgi:glycosyltransferase involved in cell wall biosynthesis
VLVVIETHPVQYHAPVYREVQRRFEVPVTAIYGSDFSVAGYRDREFGETFKWDTDLLTGYQSVFLSNVSQGGARTFEEVSGARLGQTLRRLNPKAVLIPGYRPRLYHSAFHQSRKMGCPIIFRGETTDHAQKRNPLKSFLRDNGLRWSYKRTARLLYIGQRSHEHFQRLNCPEEKLMFSPYCVDVSSFETDEAARERLRATTRESLELDQNEIVLLFSGKLSKRKGPDLLVEAIKQLPEEMRQRTTAVFLGSGEMSSELHALSQKDIQVKVVFPGFQNQSQLSKYYHAADLLVLPSREGETWGLVVNEALHHGLPCLVSDAVGCAPDLVEDGLTGYVFENNSAASLAIHLQEAVGLIDRLDVRQRCRNEVSAYSVENAAAGIAEAYLQVAKN